MAAEYESDEAAAEEISQLLYHLQVLMLAKGLSLEDVYKHLLARRVASRPPVHRPDARTPDPSRKRPPMLRVAVPNKGSLSEAASAMLAEAGYRQRRDTRELVMVDPDNDIEFFFLRPRDIAVYVGSGTPRRRHHRPRPAAGRRGSRPRSCCRSASPPPPSASPARWATSPPSRSSRASAWPPATTGCCASYLAERGIDAKVVRLDGAVESSVRLGVADAIADVVETGTTLQPPAWRSSASRSCESEAVLIRRTGADADAPPGVERSDPPPAGRPGGPPVRADGLRHPQGTGRAGRRPHPRPGIAHRLAAARRGWVAVRSMVPKQETNRIMDELYDLGARAILVSSIHACPPVTTRTTAPPTGPPTGAAASARCCPSPSGRRHPGGAAHLGVALLVAVLTTVAVLMPHDGASPWSTGDRVGHGVIGVLVFGAAGAAQPPQGGRRRRRPDRRQPDRQAAAGLGRGARGATAARRRLGPPRPRRRHHLAVMGIQPGIARQQALRDARQLRALAEALGEAPGERPGRQPNPRRMGAPAVLRAPRPQ